MKKNEPARQISEYKIPSQPSIKRNFVSLSLVLFANTVIPLITIPHLTRALGAEEFGRIAYIQALMTFVTIFTDYAFSWSGVKNISAVRDNEYKLSFVFCSIWAAQWGLTILSAIVLLLFSVISNAGSEDVFLYTLGFIAVVLGNVIFPLWFFQGIERMQEIALIQISTRIFSIPAIFLFISTPADTAKALGIQAGVSMLAGICCLYYIFICRWVQIQVPTIQDVVNVLFRGFNLFLSKFSISFYTTLAPIALGLMAGTSAVSYFALADRIRTAGQSLLTPVANTLYPRLSNLFTNNRSDASILLRKGFFVTIFLASFISVNLFLFAAPAIKLLGGDEFGAAAEVLMILAPLPLVVGLSNIFGVQIMLANGKTRPFNFILTGAAVIGAIVIWPLTLWLGAVGAAISVLGVELFVSIAMAAYLSRHVQLWKSK